MRNALVISPLLLFPFLLVIVMAWLKKPTRVTLFTLIIFGGLIGALVQGVMLEKTAGETLQYFWAAAATGASISTPLPSATELLSQGGMKSMLGSTIWLILCAMFFSGMMEKSGCLAAILHSILALFRRGRAILLGVGTTSLVSNVIAPDQYLSIVLSSRMYSDEVKKRGLKPVTLSRTVEDFGTVTSPLVPWNTCGAFIATTLGVETISYLPFAVFCLVTLIVSSYYIITGISFRNAAGE